MLSYEKNVTTTAGKKADKKRVSTINIEELIKIINKNCY